MKNLLIPILSLAILTSTAPSIFANEHDDREHAEDQEVGDREDFEEEEEETEILERNIRIEFKLLPLEENDRGVYVITASPSYATHVEFSGEDMRLALHVNGHIEVIDDNVFFVAYEVSVEYEGDEEEAEFYVESSARLIAGQAFEAASMGEKTLVIRASYADTTKE